LPRTKQTNRPGPRKRVVVKTARGRPASSTRWLQRHLNDPYVAAAAADGYRSRAAYKLCQLDDRFHLLQPGRRIVDLGAAPGGWTQVAVERAKAGKHRGGTVVAVDHQPIVPLAGALVLQLDIQDVGAGAAVRAVLGGLADVVLSDIAPPATGHRATDHLRSMVLCDAAFMAVREILAPRGAFVVKLLKGSGERALLAQLKESFAEVRYAKPKASRGDSAETYVVAQKFRCSVPSRALASGA